MLEKTKFEYFSLGMSLSKSFKKGTVKNIAKSESDFNHDSNYKFYKFYKGYDEFEEMSLDSKYNIIKEFNKLLIKFKALKFKNPKTLLKKKRIMKNVDELYEKYYNANNNDYDNDDEFNEAKKTKIDYKQFELLDQTDKKSKLDEQTKKCFKEIKNREKGVDRKGFMKYFSYEPTALINKFLGQNKQDLKQSLDQIQQQKIELNKNERNSTNNKNENDRLNTILSVIDRIDHFLSINLCQINNQMN